MKRIVAVIAVSAIVLGLIAGCTGPGKTYNEDKKDTNAAKSGMSIVMSQTGITVNGEEISNDTGRAVYTANDIVYYPEGTDFTFGEGEPQDMHSAAEALAHTVIHITKPGTYSFSGLLEAGQIAVDLGPDAKKDPKAVVNIILNGVDLTCTVAPAIIFYNVYECGNADPEKASSAVDTSAAGANITVADGTENTVNGSYVARIYESVELSEDGTEVIDSKKLHKYDGAVYSKMSLNVSGGKAGNGILNINAENEGLDSELHLTLNGGIININSGNDGINTNEDGVSVTTLNGGELNILVNGSTGEGDGIDSNGWLVINGGTLTAQACAFSQDAGIDSDMGIQINGGTVIATGHMLDSVEPGGQNGVVFTFSQSRRAGEEFTLKDENGSQVLSFTPENDFSVLVFSSPDITDGNYTLWQGLIQYQGAPSVAGAPGGMVPGGPKEPVLSEDFDISKIEWIPVENQGAEGRHGGTAAGSQADSPPEGTVPPEGFDPENMPEGMEPPEGFDPENMPEGMTPPEGFAPGGPVPEISAENLSPLFTVNGGICVFRGLCPLQ